MTVIVQIPEQSYTPRTVNANSINIPAGTKQVKLTLTRVSWPAGPCVSVAIRFHDGSPAASTGTINGGTELTPGGAVRTTSGVSIGTPTGPDLPSGNWSASATILQTLTTSVLAERF